MVKLCYPLMAVVICLGGCASDSGKPSTVILQDPETMEFVTCKKDTWTASSTAEHDRCVEDLKKKGFVVWAER